MIETWNQLSPSQRVEGLLAFSDYPVCEERKFQQWIIDYINNSHNVG